MHNILSLHIRVLLYIETPASNKIQKKTRKPLREAFTNSILVNLTLVWVLETTLPGHLGLTGGEEGGVSNGQKQF